MEEFVRNCPVCNIIIEYKSKGSLDRANRDGSKCNPGCVGAPKDPSNKICPRCKKEKSYEDFGKDSRRLSGLRSACKECECQGSKVWRENNPDKLAKSTKRYNNKPEVKRRGKKWTEDNKEKIKHKRREWRAANREKDRGYGRKRRATKASVKENYTEPDAFITFRSFDDKCFNCKSTKNLCVDHHRPLSKGNALSLSNAVILCSSCNTSKGYKDPEDFYGLKKCAKLDNILLDIEENNR